MWTAFLAGKPVGGGALSVEIELRDGEHVVGKTSKRVSLLAGTDPDAAADPTTSAPVYASTSR